MFDSIEVVSAPESPAPTPKPAERAPLQCADCEFITNEGEEWRLHEMNTGHSLTSSVDAVSVTPAVADYLTLRDVRMERARAIVDALRAAGLDGWDMLGEYEKARDAVDGAYRDMEHADRMTVLTGEREERRKAIASADALLAKYRKPAAS